MSKDITVQITVQDHNKDFYTYGNLLIYKTDCTVIETVKHVQELERPEPRLCDRLNPLTGTKDYINNIPIPEIKTFRHHIEPIKQEMKRPDGMYFMNSNAANKYATLLNTFIDYQEQQIKDLQSKLNSYEIEESVTMKHVQPEPQRKSLGMYEGVEIFESDTVYYLDLMDFVIHKTTAIKVKLNFESKYISKVYLTPKEANARQKEEVEKMAMDYKKISFNDVCRLNGNVWDYAIEAFEKDHNISYLPL